MSGMKRSMKKSNGKPTRSACSVGTADELSKVQQGKAHISQKSMSEPPKVITDEERSLL